MSLDLPKTIDEAIIRAVTIGMLSGLPMRTVVSVREFLTHKFDEAKKNHPECKEIIETLFQEIMKF